MPPHSPSPPRRKRHALRALVCAAIGLSLPPAAHATQRTQDEHEGFTLALAHLHRWDDNVFRLPAASTPPAGMARRDRIAHTALGLRFAHRYSLQGIDAALGIVDRRYAENGSLDTTTTSGSLRWEWAAGSRWRGTALLARREAPRSFGDSDRRVRSVNTLHRAGIEAAYGWHPDWSAVFGAERARSRYSDPQSAAAEYDESAFEAGVGYHPASGNRLALVTRSAHGDYLWRAPSGSGDHGYTQRDLRLRGTWTASGHSRFAGYLGYTWRDYRGLPQRDFAGPTARLAHHWTPTGKLALTTVLRRELGSEDEVLDNYVRTSGLSLEPEWRVRDKLALRGQLEWLRRDFGGRALSGIGADRRRALGVSVVWTPRDTVSLALSARHTRREATGRAFDYRAMVYGVELTLAL